jgi:hypothetical protein
MWALANGGFYPCCPNCYFSNGGAPRQPHEIRRIFFDHLEASISTTRIEIVAESDTQAIPDVLLVLDKLVRAKRVPDFTGIIALAVKLGTGSV